MRLRHIILYVTRIPLMKIQDIFNPEQICQIEEAARGQSGNTEWFVHRKCIITASFIFSSVKHFRFTPCLDIYF